MTLTFPFLTYTTPELTALPGMLIIVGKSAEEPDLAMAIILLLLLLKHTGNYLRFYNWNIWRDKKPAPAITSPHLNVIIIARAGRL